MSITVKCRVLRGNKWVLVDFRSPIGLIDKGARAMALAKALARAKARGEMERK